jgi:hypothetical protein
MASGPSGSAYTSLPSIATLAGYGSDGMGQPSGVSGRMGKRIARQSHGSFVGQKGSGSSTITGGDPMQHMAEQYSKQPPGIDDMSGGSY